MTDYIAEAKADCAARLAPATMQALVACDLGRDFRNLRWTKDGALHHVELTPRCGGSS